ncbi:glycosyl hydrolase 53 family protein [Olivibacter sp. SDN3]|uniref:glycosyl hydrolase n=1 Tax=Olivibacter sp. SDN3 TaxID=2764720 RepID=UPI00165100FF|nr:glycosyl hydrolase [Olivibacter sp. SDN3]QNL52051.1 glycosyl hydrolase 53 family protein [Olivibacter sp. SDN3]
MKKNIFFLAVIAGAFLFTTSCSKEPLVEEAKTIETSESSTSSLKALARSGNFFYGVNGHPLGTIAYTSVPAKKQIDAIKSLGMNIYRIDVLSQTANGLVTVPYLYKPLKEAADAGGVTLLPMLSARDFSFDLSTGEAYRLGRVRGDRFARRYKDDFTYYNIANEMCNKIIITGKNYSGAHKEHYDMKKFNIVAAYLKGMDEGIKSKDPDAKTIINACWMHFMYLKMLEERGVKFDIVGYHWYDDHERAALNNHGIDDITKFLSTKFNKPIWFTEIGVRNKGNFRTDQEQKEFLDSFLKKCQNNPQVKAAMIYQLFDEPEKYAKDADLGIFRWANTYNQFTPKAFAK